MQANQTSPITPTQFAQLGFSLGDKVERQAKHYTGGRTGDIIDIDRMKMRARVIWTAEPNGQPMKLRTWVRLQDLKKL